MKEIIKNLTRPEGGQTNACVVLQKISPNIYRVQDESGRTFNVGSVLSWPIGSEVSVKDSQIIGRMDQKTVSVFEV